MSLDNGSNVVHDAEPPESAPQTTPLWSASRFERRLFRGAPKKIAK